MSLQTWVSIATGLLLSFFGILTEALLNRPGSATMMLFIFALFAIIAFNDGDPLERK